MIIMQKSITFACIILVSSSSINDTLGAAAASFTTNLSSKISASCADNKSSLIVARSSSRSAISSYQTIRKKFPILYLSALSNDAEGNNKKKKQQQQQLGFRQIGGPIQPSIANQFSKEDIVTLLRNRTNARRDRHFSKADEILQTLSDAGIFVNDSRKIWRADGFFSVTEVDNDDDSGGVSNTDYVKSKKSKYINDDDTKHVLKRLEQRTEAKRNKDYMTADTIRDELRYLFHIEVNDSIKTWSVLGEEKSSFLKGDYVFGGKRVANIPEDDLSAIEDLIKQRVEAKTRKDYVVADAILADLKVRYSVRVDDKKKQWHLSPV